MADCLFCKIIAGEIPSKKIYEDDICYSFYDIDPKAPVHFLVIQKAHITGANQVNEDNSSIVGHIFAVIAQLTKQLDCGDDYRVVTNCGKMAGQSVDHLHFDVLAGGELGWPPG